MTSSVRTRPSQRDIRTIPSRLITRTNPLHVRGSDVNADVTANLTLLVLGDAGIRINGEVVSKGGWYKLFGRRYEVDPQARSARPMP